MRPSLMLVLGGLLLVQPAVAQTSQRTSIAPPVGFRWQLLPEVNGALLLPYAWNYKAETSRDAQAYFLTREKIVGNSLFKTGLTLNVVRRMTTKSRQSAGAYAQAFSAKTGRGAGQQVLSQETKTQGPLRMFGVRYRIATGAAGPKIIQQWAIANGNTDTFYLLLFESPEKDWPQAWKLGGEMIRQIRLDAGV